MRRLLALSVACVLLLVGCASEPDPQTSGDDAPTSAAAAADGDLADVTVTGEPGEKPTLEFQPPFSIAETNTRVLTEGDGPTIEEGQRVTLEYLGVNAADGEEFDTSYGRGATTFNVDPAQVIPGFANGLIGQQVGSQVLIGVTPEDGYGPQGGVEQAGIGATDTLLFVVEIQEVREVLGQAEGEEVAPVEGLPTVEVDEQGQPTITVPDTAPPTELVVQPLIVGEGPVVEEGQTITVHYSGVTWEDGEQFDSSWERGTPADFPIGTGAVIAGWDQALVGATVGSRLLLVIPPSLGYGEEGSPDGGITGDDTLVFVIDILDAA